MSDDSSSSDFRNNFGIYCELRVADEHERLDDDDDNVDSHPALHIRICDESVMQRFSLSLRRRR